MLGHFTQGLTLARYGVAISRMRSRISIHANAMLVMLTNKDEWQTWLNAPIEATLKLQRPLPDKRLKIVASGEKKDAA